MVTAYVDTSALASIAFLEPRSLEVARGLDQFKYITSSNLVEAELRSAMVREGFESPEDLIYDIDWIIPDRCLSHEFAKVLKTGFLRGPDLWHLAVALYAVTEPKDLTFFTLDKKQRTVAKKLGFKVW